MTERLFPAEGLQLPEPTTLSYITPLCNHAGRLFDFVEFVPFA
jgi:hypothetical protein